MLGLSNFRNESIHSVALEKAFHTMCLDLSFVTGRNPLNSTKTEGLAFFPENEQFCHLL